MKTPKVPAKLFWATLLVFGVTTSGVWAAPFKRTLSFQQPGGQRITLQASGDEFHARVETPDGFAVVFDDRTTAYHYATLSPDGNSLLPSGVLVGREDPKRLGFRPHLRANAAAERERIRQAREQLEGRTHDAQRWHALKRKTNARPAGVAAADLPAPPAQTTLGTKVGVCLLVDFDEEPGSVSKEEVAGFLNGEGYTGFGNNGSVRQFFLDNSGGLLNYSNVLVGYIRIPGTLHPRSYYNNLQQRAGACARQLLQDVLQILKTLPNYQSELLPVLSRATVDADNQIVACNLFVSGPDSGVWDRGLWGVRTSLDTPVELAAGGKRVASFQLSPMGEELQLATFCHENGHMLCGFPDLYDYEDDSSGGSGAFCLMGSGLGVATNPSQFCAYLKQAAGWARITELDVASELTATVSAEPGTNFNHFYRYTKPGVPTEYFLIENRQKAGRDGSIPGAGIAIWHVDELGNRDDQRLDYNSTHANYELTLVQADNQWDLQHNRNTGDTTDLYYAGNPAPAYRNSFADASTPSARWWDGSESGLLVSNFSAKAMDMTFTVGGLSHSAPRILAQPRSGPVLPGQTASLKVFASGSKPMFYQWRSNGLNLGETSHWSGTHTAELSIIGVQAADAADYSVVISNAFGCLTSAVVSLNVIADLGAALNTTGLVWQTYGDGAWAAQLSATHDGVAAVQTPALNHGQSSFLQTTVSGPGKLTFWWRLRSESDMLIFYLGGYQKGQFVDGIAGTYDWEQFTMDIPKGKQLLEWQFKRAASGSYLENAAWVDEVTFLSTAVNPPVILVQPLAQTVSVGAQVLFSVQASGTAPLRYQWRKDSAPINGATNALYAIGSAQSSDAGTYSVLVTNAAGSALSATAKLVVQQPVFDRTAPVVVIKSPRANQRVSNAALLAAGTARDNVRVDAVRYRLNQGPWTLASTTNQWSTWSAALNLVPGTNVFEAYALDASANSSPLATARLVYVLHDRLRVEVSGLGTLQPNYNTALLEIGAGYAMTATPAAGYLFSNWTGSILTNSSKLQFVMGSNLTLRANFVPNPFIKAKGTYSGLFLAAGHLPGRSGFLTLSLTDKGAYSGALNVPGNRYPFSGQFQVDGSSLKTLTAGPLGTLTLRLALDLMNNAGQITGSLEGPSWVAEVMADRANPGANWSAYQGKYTLVLTPDPQQAGLPLGYGYATASVSTKGIVTLSGKLADGAALNQTVPLSLAGKWPLYCSLYKAKGAAWGWLAFDPPTPPTAISGTLSWTKPEGEDLIGFSNAFAVSGTTYRPPATPASRVLNLTNASIVFDGTTSFANSLTLSMPGNKFFNQSTNQLSATLNAPTGKFTGTATLPGSTQKISFEGVLLQDQDLGVGFFLGGQESQVQSGKVLIQPEPVAAHPSE